jgi:site-specific recombinase
MNQISAEPQVEPTFPRADELGKTIAPRTPRHRALKQLHELIEACQPGAELPARISALERVGAWLRSKRAVPEVEGALTGESSQILRLRLLIRTLEAIPECRRRLSRTVESVLLESVDNGLFARIGLPTDRGFFGETIDRVSKRFLPEPRDERDLLSLVARLFPSPADLRILAGTPPELLISLATLLEEPQHGIAPWTPVLDHLLDAVALLPMRISAVGLSDVIRARSPKLGLEESPFFKLPRAIDSLMAAVREGARGLPALDAERPVQAQAATCRALMDECHAVTLAVVENLDRYGVSVDVVYRLELVGSNLKRLRLLIAQLEPRAVDERAVRLKSLLIELVHARLQDRKLVEIIRGNLHLLARKIIERAGHTGEHYITSTAGEYWRMLLSAGGGGVLTIGTTALKYITGWAHFAPFIEGMVSAANYAGSFIVMQLLGFTLATKQPSMTAAALAGTLRDTAAHHDLSALVAMIARITRSQLAAAIGNVGLVIPAAFFFDQAWRAQTGAPFLDPATAEYVVHSLHPTQSGTIFYAALTGVLLWMSSIVGGWVENWAVYRRLPEAIADHRLGRFVGRRTMAAASRFYMKSIAGFGGNSSLGLLLGMTPVMGKFFGLPLDVRHVTLSTGALTLSICALGREGAESAGVVAAGLGIVIIGCLNFGVSFVLALAVALRARQVARSDRLRLLFSIIATFVRSPVQFFFPVGSADAPRVHGPVSVPPSQGPHP